MKRKIDERLIIFFISFVLLVFTVLYLHFINYYKTNETITKNGQVTITNLKEGDTLELNGAWEFYPDKFIDPNDDFEKYADELEFLSIPRSRKKLKAKDKHQFGTYRLVINVDEGSYAVKYRMVRLSYDVFINGNKSSSLGTVANYKDSEISDSEYKLAIGSSKDQKLELVMHVSNHYFDNGGIFSPVEFGHASTMIKKDATAKLIEFSFVIALLTLGGYYIMLYFKRREANFLFSFGVMSISGSFILSLLSEQVIRNFINFSKDTRFILQALFFMIFVISLLFFVSQLFQKYANKKFVKYMSAFLMSSVILLIVEALTENTFLSNQLLPIYAIAVLIAIVYVVRILWNAYIEQARGYLTSTFLSLTLINYIFLIMVKTFMDIELGYSQQIIFTVAIASSIFLIADIYRFDYEYALELDRVIKVGAEKREGFIKSLLKNVLVPLEGRIKDMESLMVDEKNNLHIESLSKLRFIRNQTQEIVYMLQDIGKAFADLEPNYEFKTVKLKQVISDNLARFTSSNDTKNVQFINHLDLDVFVNIDESNFAIAMYHVLRNALDSVGKSGEIIITGKIIENIAFIYIDDNGIGIDERDLPYIFDSFYKVDQDNMDRFGLGLPLARNVLENHRGLITVQSSLGVGTRVSIGLPISEGFEAENLNKEVEVPTLEPVKLDLKVMIVSENIDLVENLKKTYRHLSHKVYEKHSQEKLAKDILNQSIDVLILDYTNPLLLQDRVSHHLRKYIDVFNTPILMIASQQIIVDMWFHQQVDVSDFIATPIDYRNLILKINNLYQSKKAIEKGIEKEFRYLHSQISPHFLYNTLNTIIGISYTDSEKTREALYNLSIYFRAKLDVFDTELFVPIHTEIDVIKSYLNIEKLRHGDHVQINLDINESLKFKVPSLMIQNIVENTFKHAFNLNKPNNKISISIKKENENNIIIISDNGKGMDEKTMDKIRNKESSGYGFRNTFERISLIKDGDLNIESKLNEGTTIKIILPEVRK